MSLLDVQKFPFIFRQVFAVTMKKLQILLLNVEIILLMGFACVKTLKIQTCGCSLESTENMEIPDTNELDIFCDVESVKYFLLRWRISEIFSRFLNPMRCRKYGIFINFVWIIFRWRVEPSKRPAIRVRTRRWNTLRGGVRTSREYESGMEFWTTPWSISTRIFYWQR